MITPSKKNKKLKNEEIDKIYMWSSFAHNMWPVYFTNVLGADDYTIDKDWDLEFCSVI